MEALTAKAALVDSATLDNEGSAVTTRIPRSEIEEAARAGGPSDFFLDVARVRNGDREQPEVEAEHRITVSWDPDDLEQLLRSTTADEVTLAFKPDELARMFEEPDVEAQGLREKVAILTVAATTAAGISAGVAGAQTVAPVGDSGSGSAAAFVTDATSSGPGASTEASGGTSFVTDATSSGPGASTEAASAGGGGQSWVEGTGGEAALAGGLALLIVGAGFIGTRQRRGVQPA